MIRAAGPGGGTEKGTGDAARLEPSATDYGYVSRETMPPDEIFDPESDRSVAGKVVVKRVKHER
ncbi:MAG: hypothetical protein ACOYVI_01625 [Bacillota bacterium]